MLQTGYTSFIKLIEAPDYRQFEDVHSIYKDPVWNTETRKNKAELERVAFYHCDQVGTPHSLSNELGECVWEMTQDTWGTALAIKASEHLLEQTNLRFQGQYYDKETGLHYNRYRYYEPYSARYVSKDPIGLEGGLNNSSYVNDPNQWVDPMGLQNKKSDYDKAMAPFNKVLERKVVADVNERNSLVSKKKSIDERARKSLAPQNTRNNKLVVRDREIDQINRVEKFSKSCANKCVLELDYISGSIGKGPLSVGISINTHNKDVFISPMNISMQGGKNSYMEITQRALGMASNAILPLNTSIGFGHIFNMEDTNRADGTTGFLTGEAVTISGTIPRLPISIGATTSTDNLKGDLSNIHKKTIGGEILLTNGKGIDVTRSNSIPLQEVTNKIKTKFGLGD